MDEQTDGRTNENERTDKQKKIIFLKESLCFAQNLKKQVFLFSMIMSQCLSTFRPQFSTNPTFENPFIFYVVEVGY